jgi:hypothetical protein
MNPLNNNRSSDPLGTPEETLRMLAQLPPPEGLSARVQASLRTAPRRGGFSFGNVLGLSGWMHSTALRTAAAFGIVCVVAGGGWRIYSHVQTSSGMQGVAVPVHVNTGDSSPGGFSTSGAIAKPDPLKAPVIAHQVQTPAQTTPLRPDAKEGVHKRKKLNPAPQTQQRP